MKIKKIALCFVIAIFVFDFVFTVTGLDIIPIGNAVNVSSNIMAYEVNIIYLSCTPSWSCGSWSNCVSSTQTRTCTDLSDCGTNASIPSLSQACVEGTFGGSPDKEEPTEVVSGKLPIEIAFGEQARKILLNLTLFTVFLVVLALIYNNKDKIKIPFKMK
jgi:hypothetical protein